jgi:hypothetical protein
MRNFGHVRSPRVDGPDSVTDPFERDFPCEVPFRQLDDSETLTRGQVLVICVYAAFAGVFGAMVAHGYYLWFLR